MAILPVYALTVYGSDDATPLFDVSTDPAHARPYLKAPTGFPEQEVDFAKGAASIGQVNLQIVDVRQTATDQDTGYLTGQLADSGGNSQLNGHRALLTEDVGGGPVTVLDGVIRSVRLLDTFATYELELRDIRERERKTKAFETTDSPTILPRGILNGYGVTVNGVKYPVPATSPLTATYRSQTASSGYIDFTNGNQTERVLTEPMREALSNVAPVEGELETLVYDHWKVLWRDKATGGAYTTVDDVAHRGANVTGRTPFTEGQGRIVWLVLNNFVSGAALPTNGQEIEVIVQYDGPPTSDWPHIIQDLTVGELIRDLYRGDHSVEDPRIRYDETALLDLKTPVRGRIEEPIDDLRAWTEEHAYPIANAAPTLNAAGEISPIRYVLPDAGVSLVNLSDSNCAAAGGGWSHSSENAVNVVRATYKRDYRVRPKQGERLAISDQVRKVEVTTEHRVQSSIDLLGEQVLEVKSDLLRSIGTADGEPLSGDVTDETGTQVARLVGRLASDRWVLGGQYFALKGDRGDSNVEGLKVGSWVSVGVSWMPDYVSGTRGASRLAQVVGRRNLNGAWCLLTLIDAGSDNAPLGQPTLGTITANADGVVSIPVDALATGSPDARVDFAVNDTEPASDSELWTFLDRADSIETLTTYPLPAGATCWVRARSEAPGERPSAYTTAVSVAIPQTARFFYLEVEIGDDGVPTFNWSPNQFCLGVQIAYEVHQPDTAPTFPNTVDVDATLETHTLSGVLVPDDWIISAEVTPYDGWTGSAVTGTAGPVVEINSETGVALDLDGVFQLRPVPVMSGTNRRHELRLSFDLDADVDEVDITVDYIEPGPDPQNYTYTVSLSGSGLHTIHESAITSTPARLTDGATSIAIAVTPKNTTYSKSGRTVVKRIEDLTDTGSGIRVFDGTNEYLAPRFLAGSGISLGLNNGEPELSSPGGVNAIDDIGDVAITTPADDEVLAFDSGSGEWINQTAAEAGLAVAGHTHAASEIDSGTFADARIAQSNVTQHQAAIDHDQLTGFVAAEHVDWAVTGTEDVHADRITAASVAQHEGSIDHDALLNFATNEHINHTTVSIQTAAESGLAGGGTIAATRSLSLDIENLHDWEVADGLQGADKIAMVDVAGDLGNKAIRIDQLDLSLMDNSTSNFTANAIDSASNGLVNVGGDVQVEYSTSANIILAADGGLLTGLAGADSILVSDSDNVVHHTSLSDLESFWSIGAAQVTPGTFGAGDYTFPGQVFLSDGSASALSLALASDTDLGFYRLSGNFLGISGSLNISTDIRDEQLRLTHGSATGSPQLSLYQDATRRSFIQHHDTNDDLRIVSEYGNVSIWSGTGGSEVLRLDIDPIDATHGRFRFSNGQVHTVEGAEITRGTAGAVTLDWDAYNAVPLRNDGNIDTINIDDGSMQDGNSYRLVVRYASGGQASITFAATGTLIWQFGDTPPTMPTGTLGDRMTIIFEKTDGITLGYYAAAEQ